MHTRATASLQHTNKQHATMPQGTTQGSSSFMIAAEHITSSCNLPYYQHRATHAFTPNGVYF
jgi:hypothetical protein